MPQWPIGANEGPKQRVYDCPGCSAISSSPINHDHSKDRRSGSGSGQKK